MDEAETKAGGLYEESQRERRELVRWLRRSELAKEEEAAAVVVGVRDWWEWDFARDG